jgi:translocation and assembly module TamA
MKPPSRPLCRGLSWLAAALLASATPQGGRAADPQPYQVVIAPSGDGALDQAVHDSATLISLRNSAPVGPFALVARARADMDRFTAALHSFGYYDGTAAITIAGRPLSDPDLPAALAATPARTEVPVAVTLKLGPMFHLRHITVTGDAPADALARLGLTPGAPALAANVLAARDRLLSALRDSGHALAKVDLPVAILVPAARALDVSYRVAAGPRVDLGPITIDGLKRMHESFVRRRLLLHPGERYDPKAIETARQDLGSIGAFSAVRITTADQVDAAGQLPVQVRVTERKLRSVQLGAAYSTDLGGSVTASWTHHNLFGNAEQLTLSAAATELGGTAALQPGYNVSAMLTLPDWGHRDQSLSFNAAAIKEYLEAYDRTAYQLGTTLSRKLNPELTVNVGLQGEQAHFIQESVSRDYTLLQVPLSASYDSTHAPLDPTRGVRATLSVTPSESFSNRNATFVIAQASGSVYLDLHDLGIAAPGRSVLAARALVGGVEAATTFDIPPDQRFYAGGGGSVRGFKFQSIGPDFSSGTPIGGTAVDVGSVEFRQRFGASYGAVAFVDAGQVGSAGVPFEGNVEVGAGVGARYYTSFGPIRIDFAVPVTHQSGNDSFEVYLGIGQAF